MNKKVQKLLSVLVSGGMMMSFLPVNAESAGSVPVPVYSMDFSGYSSDSTDPAKGITASGDAAQGSSITVNNATGGVIKATPQDEIHYMDFDIPERIDNVDQKGIEISFANSICADDKGKAKDMTVDFWINIPGPELTGKYARYFSFYGEKVEMFDLENLDIGVGRLSIGKGGYTYLYAGEKDKNGSSGAHTLNMYDKWTHFTITQSAAANTDDSAKTDYSVTLYVNGTYTGTSKGTSDIWYAAPDTLYLGINSQNSDTEGTQRFKLGSFNVYDSILTADDAASIYEATKTPYTETAPDTFDFVGADVSRAVTDGIITLEFDNYPGTVNADEFAISDTVLQTVEVIGKTIQLKAAAPLTEGKYVVTLPDSFKSFNDIEYTGIKEIKINAADKILFSLSLDNYSSESTDSSKGICDISYSGSTITAGSSLEVNSFVNSSAQTVPYLQFTHTYGNNTDKNDNIKIENLTCPELNGSMGSYTVEFWANIERQNIAYSGYPKLFLAKNGNSHIFNMQSNNTGKDRYIVNIGNNANVYLGTAEKGINVVDTWAHYVIEVKALESETEGKYDYTSNVYVNGSLYRTASQTAQNPISVFNKFYIGDAGDDTPTYKLADFNIYEGAVGAAAAENYENEKDRFVPAPTSFDYNAIDTSAALSEGKIKVKFDYDVSSDASTGDFTLEKNGENIEISNVTVTGNTVTLTSAQTLTEGRYLLTVSENLKSVYNFSLGEAKAVDFMLDDGLVFALDFSQAADTDTEGDSEGVVDLAKVTGASISSYADFAAEEDTWGVKIPYIQINKAVSNKTETRIEAALEEGILSAEDEYGAYAGDITVEFWAKIAKEQGNLSDGYNNYATLFDLKDSAGRRVINMEVVNGSVDRFNVNPGDGSQLYTTAGGKSVLDTWAHFVITRKCEYDSSNTANPYKYTVTEYVNGESKGSRSLNINARPGAVKTIGIGAVGNGTVDYKLYNFNIYNKQQTADWAQTKYNSEKEIFERDTELFADGPVVINLDSISENFKLTGAQVDVKIKNIFNTDKPYSVMIAGYDNNGSLVCVKSSDKKQLVDGKNEVILECHMTEDVSEIKAFVWFEDMIPLSKAEKNDEFTVAFVGDSITHRGNYTKAIETYYTTRYPDKKINFVNKGINAHSFNSTLSRFDWDILNEPVDGLGEKAEMNVRPDAVTVMLGVNDIGHGNYADQTEDEKAARVNSVLTNAEVLIKRCIDEKIELTIITPLLVDVKPDNWTDDMNLAEYGSNEGVGRVANGLLSLADKYKKGGEFNSDVNVDVINMWQETTALTQRIRSQDKTINVMTDNDVDQVHPDSNGGFVMGYFFAKNAKLADGSAANSSVVASVKIDAASKALGEIVNAEAELINASADSITYKYRPNALPMPVSKEYEYAEQTLGLPVTEDLNKELITVTGLSDGNYKIMIDGIELTQTHTADELATGVNIATDKNNPGQISALASYEEICNKATIENYYRWIAQRFTAFMGYYPGAFTYDELKAAIETKWADNEDRKTSSLAELDEYFGVTEQSGNNIYKQKQNQQAGWDLITGYADAAKKLAEPTEHTVVIAPVQ